jgi:hypothetical protein
MFGSGKGCFLGSMVYPIGLPMIAENIDFFIAFLFNWPERHVMVSQLQSTDPIFGRLGHDARVMKGRRNEDRVMDALIECQGILPEWFWTAYPGTPEQDGQGIDYVVETRDLGIVYLQIKSSERFANKFKRRQRRGGPRRDAARYSEFIAVATLDDRVVENEQVVARILQGLEKARQRIISHRTRN